jgi:hypothetical protein
MGSQSDHGLGWWTRATMMAPSEMRSQSDHGLGWWTRATIRDEESVRTWTRMVDHHPSRLQGVMQGDLKESVTKDPQQSTT